MILYHGSYMEICVPDLRHSRSNVDFGCGFYTTPIYDQAAKWCEKFKRRGEEGIVSCYEFEDNAYNECKTMFFESYSEDWLNFILSCRSGKDTSDYEIVAGGVANDKVFNTIELYLDGLIDKAEAISRLRYEKPNMQICFRTEEVLKKYVHFERSERI